MKNANLHFLQLSPFHQMQKLLKPLPMIFFHPKTPTLLVYERLLKPTKARLRNCPLARYQPKKIPRESHFGRFSNILHLSQ